MVYYVYLLKCSDTTYYCGSTKNIEQRIKQHNSSKIGAKYTKTRRPVELVYFERYDSLNKALKREYEIKKLPRNKKTSLINEFQQNA